MTRRKREIVGLTNNRTSRIWSNSQFRREATAKPKMLRFS